MPTMTTCVMNGNIIDIHEALRLRDQTDNRGVAREVYLCVECNQPVRAHSDGSTTSAHFEHLERNPACNLSHRA